MRKVLLLLSGPVRLLFVSSPLKVRQACFEGSAVKKCGTPSNLKAALPGDFREMTGMAIEVASSQYPNGI